MKSIKKFIYIVIIIAGALCFNDAYGQQIPDYPLSYRIFSPFIFNPAIAGSKDYSSIDILASNYGNSKSQIISGNMRISKSVREYFASQSTPQFKKIGIGGYLFNDLSDSARNIGIGGTAAYHFQLDKNALSFLSFGVTIKGVLNDYQGNTDLHTTAEKTFLPQIDAGIYYYNPHFYAGISATNLLENTNLSDSLGIKTIPVSRQLFFQIGYKFVLSRSLNILLEPSLIVNSDFSFSGKTTDYLKPGLKLYADNICIGTFFNDFKKTSFFLQYKYSMFYLGSYFEFANNESFFRQPIRVELAVGFNMSAIKSGFPRKYHW